MKKIILNSVLAIGLLHVNIQAMELDNSWSVLGDIKAGYVNYDYDNPPSLSSSTINKGHVDSKGFYAVPKVSLLTPTYNNFSAKVTVAGVTDFGVNNPDYESRNFVFDSTDKEPFAILQEVYLNYKDKNHNITVGRNELITPLIESDDYYLLGDSYESVNYTNTSLDSYTFHLGYIWAMAGVWDSGANGTEFHSISETSFVSAQDKKNAGDSGVSYIAAEYKNKSHKVKIWEYYITDLYNMFLAQYDFSSSINGFSYNFAMQFTNYKEVGALASNNFTNIDYSIYALKFDGAFENGFDFATGASKFSDGDGIGSTLSAWGGFPTYTYGFIYNWFDTGNLRDANLYKAQLGYNLSKLGIKHSWIGYRYTYYDLDSTYSKTAVLNKSQDSMSLNGIRFKYTPKTGMYFIANYEHRVLSNEPDTSAYRLIGGYKF